MIAGPVPVHLDWRRTDATDGEWQQLQPVPGENRGFVERGYLSIQEATNSLAAVCWSTMNRSRMSGATLRGGSGRLDFSPVR